MSYLKLVECCRTSDKTCKHAVDLSWCVQPCGKRDSAGKICGCIQCEAIVEWER